MYKMQAAVPIAMCSRDIQTRFSPAMMIVKECKSDFQTLEAMQMGS